MLHFYTYTYTWLFHHLVLSFVYISCVYSCFISPAESIRHLFQRCSIALWRGNAALWIHRCPVHSPAIDGALWLFCHLVLSFVHISCVYSCFICLVLVCILVSSCLVFTCLVPFSPLYTFSSLLLPCVLSVSCVFCFLYIVPLCTALPSPLFIYLLILSFWPCLQGPSVTWKKNWIKLDPVTFWIHLTWTILLYAQRDHCPCTLCI